MRSWLLGFLALLSSTAYAGNLIGKYGLGIMVPDSRSVAEVKLFSLGYQHDYWKDLLLAQYELGVFADAHGENRKSSGYIAASTGIRVSPGAVYAEVLWGVALITSPDSMLSTVYEFTNDTVIGLRDSRGRAFGIGYKHFSNAGIKLPNKGRDFILVHLQFPL